MTTLIKILSLLILFTDFYAHGMEIELTKDSRLELPNEILGNIIKCATQDDILNATKLLIRLSRVCKKFEHLSEPNRIKTVLNLNQKTLDYSLIKYGELDVTPFFELLITMGANINTHYNSLMSCIAFSTNGFFTKRFLETSHNANINEQNKEGITPLRWVIDLNKPGIVQVLLEHGADMYIADNQGKTPMHYALLSGKIECIKLLIQHGVDTSIEYDWGRGYKTTIAEWAKLGASCNKENADVYHEIYKMATGEEISRSWDEKSVSELLNDTCIIS